jgi:hypothetical protein
MGEEIFAETFVKKIHSTTMPCKTKVYRGVKIFGATSLVLDKTEIMKLVLFSVLAWFILSGKANSENDQTL